MGIGREKWLICILLMNERWAWAIIKVDLLKPETLKNEEF